MEISANQAQKCRFRVTDMMTPMKVLLDCPTRVAARVAFSFASPTMRAPLTTMSARPEWVNYDATFCSGDL
jgi:hypothetical protein